MLSLKESVGILQAHYPDRLKTGIVTEPAFWMKTLYNILWHVMSEQTREKVQLAYGEVCSFVDARGCMDR